MDIIIFCGQSNMQGQSEALTGRGVIYDAFEYRYLKRDMVPLQDPVGEDITYEKGQGTPFTRETVQSEWLKRHVTGSSCYGHTSLVPEFCRGYTETSGHQVLAVHVAKGSTEITDWLPGSAGYEMLVEKSCGAIACVREQDTVGRIFFVWLQGESDAIFGCRKEDYKQKMNMLCQALKRDVGMERFGVIRVGRFTGDDRDLEIISAQDEICRGNSDFVMLTDLATTLNEQTEAMNPLVAGHYSALGLEMLGAAAGKTLGNFVGN